MTYAQAVDYLYGLRLFGTKLGLDATRRLAALAGQPQERLRFIHVAGTNGKGSVCAMLESMYRHAGYRVGLYTSPHLVRFGERMQVNRREISEAEVVDATQRMQALLADFPAKQHPTFFEVVTVMALAYFAEQACDLVLWETGMGGRLDATNIVTPLASVITQVGWDHQRWLGSSLAQIAREKAGIIKPGVPVLTSANQDEVLREIQQAAQKAHAPCMPVPPPRPAQPPGQDPNLIPSLRGDHQRHNAALALACVDCLQSQLPVGAHARAEGLAATRWPGRFQVVRREDGPTVVLDGAHNADGMAALRRTMHLEFPNQRPAVLIGILEDKDMTAMMRELIPMAGSVHWVAVRSMRSALPEDLLRAGRAMAPALPMRSHPDLATAWAHLAKEPLVLITGSIYLVGEAMEQLGLQDRTANEEKRLNEWGPVSSEACLRPETGH